jgi:hypothetical protein
MPAETGLPGVPELCESSPGEEPGQPARRVSAPPPFARTTPARGTPEEEAQAAAVRGRGPFRPSPEGPVQALLLKVQLILCYKDRSDRSNYRHGGST